MSLDHTLVGVASEPQERSWTSTDALLYAVGVGAGLGDPLRELEFTTENTEGRPQRVLPTYAVLIAQTMSARGLGDFDRALLVHAEQGFELHQPLPVAGTARTVSTVTGIYDKGAGALVVSENVAEDTATGAKLVTSTSSVYIKGEGGFGGDRGASGALAAAHPARGPHGDHAHPAGTGAAVPAVRRQEPTARGPGVRGPAAGSPADPARPVHLRVHRARAAAHALRLEPGPVPVHVRAVHPAGAAR